MDDDKIKGIEVQVQKYNQDRAKERLEEEIEFDEGPDAKVVSNPSNQNATGSAGRGSQSVAALAVAGQ